jgi:LmbE family N-acetylglucosaminyl deacetylase
MSKNSKTALVVSAHSADFVWRAGGAIALYASRGYKVIIVCLSYGERGESAKLWKQEGYTLEKVKAERRAEAEQAAEILGGETVFFDLGDYPMRVPTIPTTSIIHWRHTLHRKRASSRRHGAIIPEKKCSARRACSCSNHTSRNNAAGSRR